MVVGTTREGGGGGRGERDRASDGVGPRAGVDG